MIEFADWIRNRLEALAAANPEDADDYLQLLPRLLPWQRWLLVHALELLPGHEDDLVFRFRVLLFLVGRQNGKTTLLVYLILWRLFQDGARTVIGTAQSLEVAEEAWSLAVAVAESIPELADEIAKVKEGKGSQVLELDGRERYKIAAANRRGGRGLTGDLVIFDELREHQTWKSWSAASKTTMARPRAQVWGVSNAGDLTGIVLRHLRKIALSQMGTPEALAALGDTAVAALPDGVELPDGAEIGIFEWSAKKGRDVWDREGWAESNPSLGVTITEAAIAAAAAGDPEDEFRTEVLCQFLDTAGTGPFPAGSWLKTHAPKVIRDKERPLEYGVDMSHDRAWITVDVAFWDTEGRRRVEVAARRAGSDWLVPWLTSPDRAVKCRRIALQARGAPISSLVTEIEEAGIEVVEWGGPELAGWTGLFYDDLRRAVDEENDPEVVLTHGEQGPLDVAAASAQIKPLGDGWVIDRKASAVDVAPLCAAIAAVGLLRKNVAARRSAYEDRDVLVL